MRGIKIDNPKAIEGYVGFHYVEETALWYLFRWNNMMPYGKDLKVCEVKLVRQVQQSGRVHIILRPISVRFGKTIIEISLDDLSAVDRFVDCIQAACHSLK